MAPLDVEVVKAVRAAVPVAAVAQTLVRAVQVPELAARMPAGRVTLAVRITSDAEMRRLNREYASEDHATDVLSFAGEGDHIGDIAISWPAVVRQAAEHGHTAATELALLGVHGLLHLLGWDHASPAERQEMSRLMVAALRPSRVKPAMKKVFTG